MSSPRAAEPPAIAEDSDIEDVCYPVEEDFFDFCPCPVETCFGDWMNVLA